MKLSGSQIGILVFGLTTALLHLLLFPAFHYKFDMVVLNGFGYLGLLGAYFLPIPFFQQRHKLVWWGLVGYTILTIILWVILGKKDFAFDFSTPSIGYYAKVAELFLLFFLWRDRK